MISVLISGVDSFSFSLSRVSFGSDDDFDCSDSSFLISGSSSSDVESSVKASLIAEKSSASGFCEQKNHDEIG